MARREIEVKVGLAIILGFLILILGTMWIKGYWLRHQRYELTVHFKNVMGLKVGDSVTIAGVKKGQVKSISLSGQDVLVTLLLDKEVKLYSDARIVIRERSLMGQKVVTLDPGQSGVEISPPIYGIYQPGIGEVVQQVGNLMVEAQQLVAQLENTVGDEHLIRSFRQSLENTREVTETLKRMVNQNLDDLTQSIQDFRVVSRELRRLVGNQNEGIGSAMVKLNRSADQFEEVLSQLEQVSNSLYSISQKVDRGEGTLGMLINDPQLYHDLRRVSSDLDTLIKAIRENPEKYLKVKVGVF